MGTAVLGDHPVMLLPVGTKREGESDPNVRSNSFEIKTAVINGIFHLIQVPPDKSGTGSGITQTSGRGLEVRLQQREISGLDGFE